MLEIPPIGFHCLRDFEKRGSAYWKGRYLDRTIPKPFPSTAMLIGTAVHALALEGSARFTALFATAPAGEWDSEDRKIAQEITAGQDPHKINEMPNRRMKEGKVQWLAIVEAAAGQRIMTVADRERLEPLVAAYRATAGRDLLSAADYDMVVRMGEAVRAHPDAMDLIGRGQVEVELDASIHLTGIMGDMDIPVRGRLDVAGPGYVVDLKSCEDLTPATFDRTVTNYEYHRQLAYYDMLRDLAGDETPVAPDARGFLIAVEKPDSLFAPVRVAVIALEDAFMNIGYRDNLRSLETLAGTFMGEAWSPLVPGIRRMPAPRWLT